MARVFFLFITIVLCAQAWAGSLKVQMKLLSLKLRVQQDELADLRQQLLQTKEDFNTRMENFESTVTDLSLDVAFSACLDKNFEDMMSPMDTIVFKTVKINNGNAYNPNTGEFTAPKDGTYAFYSNILTKADHYIETTLRVNNEDNVAFIYSAGATAGSFRGSGSNMAVLDLKSGDTVKLALHAEWGTKPYYIHKDFSTFSGFLVKTAK